MEYIMVKMSINGKTFVIVQHHVYLVKLRWATVILPKTLLFNEFKKYSHGVNQHKAHDSKVSPSI
jgi:hypothetical protein